MFINRSTGFNDPDGYYPKDGYIHSMNIRARGKVEGEPDGLSIMETTRTQNKVEDQVGTEQPKEVTPEMAEKIKKAAWMPIAVGETGISEETNPTRIQEYLKVGGGINGSELIPWCASFVGWTFNQVQIKGTRSGLARSYLNWGQPVDTNNIPYGSVAVFSSSRGPSSGHVAFVTQDLGDSVEVLGGNQSNNGKSKGAVTKTTFSKSKLLGARWPSDLETATPIAME